MRFALDLDADLRRIGHAGTAAPDLATRRTLALAHAVGFAPVGMFARVRRNRPQDARHPGLGRRLGALP